MSATIKEMLGWSNACNIASESETRNYYIAAESPEEAKEALRNYVTQLTLPDGWSVEQSVDEEKGANGLFFARITIQSPRGRVKTDHQNGILELYGERQSLDRHSSTCERMFRVKADTAEIAKGKLSVFIQESMPSEGRLHLESITVTEETDTEGYCTATVSYSNPDNKADDVYESGTIQAFGERVSISRGKMTREAPYELYDYTSLSSALSALRAAVAGSGYKSIEVEEDQGGAAMYYTGRVMWESDDDEEEEESEDARPVISFEIGGTTTSLKYFLGAFQSYAPEGKTAKNHYGAINATKDGIDGVEIDVAEPSFIEVHKKRGSAVTPAYLRLLAKAYGKVNSAPFRSFAAGEVRFIGASLGGYTIGDKWCEITYKFSVSPNIENFEVGTGANKISEISKRGFDLVWVDYGETTESVASQTESGETSVQVPVGAYSGPIYHYMDFAALEIGEQW